MTVFNHIGLCVTDRKRSRRFYEGVLDFRFWWELDPPDEATATLLGLAAPVGLHATYLIRDGLVLELLDYSGRPSRVADEARKMNDAGLTHMSFSVPDLPALLTKVVELGGEVIERSVSANSAMIRDPDGQLLEVLTEKWLGALPPRPG